MEENKSGCATCKHETLPSGIEPCCHCIDYKNWEPKGSAPEAPVVGIDPGTPEGVDQLKDGHLRETAWAVMKQITRLDYAIEGVRSKISSIGLKFTDRDMSLDKINLLGGQLNALRVDLFELEEEREALRKAGEHGNGND